MKNGKRLVFGDTLEERLFLIILMMSVLMPLFWLSYRIFFFPNQDLVIFHSFTLITGVTLYIWYRRTGAFDLISLVYFFYSMILLTIAYFPTGGIQGASMVFSFLMYCAGLLVLHPRFFVLFSVLVITLNLILPTIEYIFPEMVENGMSPGRGEILGRMVSNVVSFILLGICLYYFKKEYVTEDNRRQLMNERLRKEKEKLESSERYKAMFFNTVSQEVHAPLSAIALTIDSFADEELTDDQIRLVEKLQNYHELLSSILSDVLDVSQEGINKAPIRQVEFNLRNEIQELIDILEKGQQGEEAIYQYEHQQGVPEVVTGDPLRIKQTISSLIHSSTRQMHGSEVKVESILLMRSREAITIRFSITCKGAGVSKRTRAEMFKKFYEEDKVTAEVNDFGLGVLLPKSLVESMGGIITFSYDEAYNFNFSFDIPFQPAA